MQSGSARRKKGVAGDPPLSSPKEESGSAGRDGRLREKTINRQKILKSAAKHMTGPTHGRGRETGESGAETEGQR